MGTDYDPALDGIRAAAVLAVIGYHSFGWLPGGFYGVDAFFVLSGFLITRLLTAELDESGTIKLAHFWNRRARRLLPALFTMVAAVVLLSIVWSGAFGDVNFTGDALATLGYAANWYFIAAHHGYFAAVGPPSPLLHTWSLAIEEQFYLVWPIIVLLLARRRALFAFCVIGAVASALWMAELGGTRAYYGTDTRAQALLVGAGLALFIKRSGPRPLAAFGVLGTAAMWGLVTYTSWFAFHGGFLVASVAAAAVISGVLAAPEGFVARALSKAQGLGRISYGVYLWYWPVLLVLEPSRMHASGWLLFAERLSVTVALAALSARFIERPFRTGGASLGLIGAGAAVAVGLVVWAIPVAAPLAAAPAGAAVRDASSVKILLVGDSIAGSLGVGLSEDGARIENEGAPGCSLSMDEKFKALFYTISPGPPCKTGDPAALLTQWSKWVDAWNPDVVVYVARGDLFDQQEAGTWSHVGETHFDQRLAKRFAEATRVLSAHGATVVLLSSPFYDSGAQPSGSPWPEDQPARAREDSDIMEHVDGATVLNLGKLVSPQGHYAAVVDGVPMRCSDGVHFTAAGGQWVGKRLLPEIIRLGEHHAAISPGGTWVGKSPPAVPSWWKKLPCS